MKKSIKYGNRIVDIDFSKTDINISVWKVDDTLPSGYEYVTEYNVEVDNK